MKGDTKRRGRSLELSLEAPSHLKRSRRTSSESECMYIMNNIDDLPCYLLVEILCRLPCNKLVFQCKCVSKHWCTLICDPYFIGRFLRLQFDKQKTIMGSSLINPKGENIPTGISYPVFKRLMRFHGLKETPVVVGTYNDLVLCCASEEYQRDYYICNPYTMQWVALPPAPNRWKDSVPVGLICDTPYCGPYNDHVVQVNAEYRCMVVRILRPEPYYKSSDSFKFFVELFSFETGKWTDFVVSSDLSLQMMNHKSLAYNGMLYWLGDMSGRLLGLDPFIMYNIANSTGNGDDIMNHYKCRVVDELAVAVEVVIQCPSVHGGCVRMCDYTNSNGLFTLYVWELKEELQNHEDDHRVVHGTGKFFLKDVRAYLLDSNYNMVPKNRDLLIESIAFDPGNEDIFYSYIDGNLVKCNIRTREWSKLPADKITYNVDDEWFPYVLPCWPTPVPRLPQQARP